MATAKFQKQATATVNDAPKSESAEAYITRRAIEGLQNKKCAWRRTWKSAECAPMNFITGNPYRGYNWLIGMIDAAITGRVPMYATYNQITDARKDGHVIAGEKSNHKVAFSSKFFKDKDGKTVEYKTAMNMTAQQRKERGIVAIPFLKLSAVFHIDQTEGYDDKKITDEKLKQSEFNPIEKAEALLDRIENVMGCKIERKLGKNAAYYPELDVIRISDATGYEKTVMYYRSLFHEITHWTGHKDRLNRSGIYDGFFNKDEYSREELVAELGSQMLLDYCGIDDSEVLDISQGYINGWMEKLSSDVKMLSVCANMASKAFSFLVGKTEDETEV